MLTKASKVDWFALVNKSTFKVVSHNIYRLLFKSEQLRLDPWKPNEKIQYNKLIMSC